MDCIIEIKQHDGIIYKKIKYIRVKIDELKSTIKTTKENFYLSTLCNWKDVEESIEFKPNYISHTGSQYMYTDEGVYRKSNHWGYRIASCIWLLNGEPSEKQTIAFAKWEDFKKFGSKKHGRNTYNRKCLTKMIKHNDYIREENIGLLKI
jgi:hypothetical protein